MFSDSSFVREEDHLIAINVFAKGESLVTIDSLFSCNLINSFPIRALLF
jgi:hypothetical protein